MITKEERAAIKAREQKATPGPWSPYKGFEEGDEIYWHAGPTNLGRYIPEQFNSWATAEFIAHAREDIPRLVEEVELLTKLLLQAGLFVDVCKRNNIAPESAKALGLAIEEIRKELGE